MATAAARTVRAKTNSAAARRRAKGAAVDTYGRLRARHSDAHCELDHVDPYQLIIATVLSAQSTDVAVNQVTPELFQRYPTPEMLAKANQPEIEKLLNRLGMFRQKSKNIIGLAQKLVADHSGKVPDSLEALVELPGVGRKTANVVLGVAFNKPEGVVVDTHVQRISQRLGWTEHTDPVDIEQDLMRLFPKHDWDMLSHVLIFHGRRICTARSPACAACPVSDACPSAFAAELVGRKPPRQRGPAAKVVEAARKVVRAATSSAKSAAKPGKRDQPAKRASKTKTKTKTRR